MFKIVGNKKIAKWSKRLLVSAVMLSGALWFNDVQAETIEVANNSYTRFTPTENTYYSILTRGNEDTIIKVYNKEKGIFIYDDNSGQNENACIYYKLEQGLTYDILVKTKDGKADKLILEIEKGMPTSGYEQTNWEVYKDYELTNNCYTYMLGVYRNVDGTPFRVNGKNPGELGGHSLMTSWLLDRDFVDMLVQNRVNSVDGFKMYPIEEGAVARDGFYKVALVLTPKYDIHWYRQNADGTWSHKPGTSPVRFVDWSNEIIYNPKQSDLGLYEEFVNFYEVENINLISK